MKKLLDKSADILGEIMIEAESRCNFNCKFCFNKVSFAEKGRGKFNLSSETIRNVIDQIAQNNIPIVRFTGGEPLLRKDIFELLTYAKAKGLYVKLNTNGSLVTKEIAEKLAPFIDNVLIPIESCSDQEEEKITGYPKALKKKITAIKHLRKAGISYVRAGTVMSRKSIQDFDKIALLVLRAGANMWEWYRPIGLVDTIKVGDVKKLVRKIIAFNKDFKLNTVIANAIPFCISDNPAKMESVAQGAVYDEGNSRLVIDVRGFVKPDYFMNNNIGSADDVMGAWNSVFIKKMRTLKFLPLKCRSCEFKQKCRGGSRQMAKNVFGSYDAPDPLMKK